MSAGWTAGSVRARGIARRRIGADAARRMAVCRTLGEALDLLADTAYRSSARDLAAVQWHVAASVLWDLRVLAGWLPQGGDQLMRAVAGWFEIANVDEKIQQLSGRPAVEFFELGALATAWPRLERSASLTDLRAALAASAWQDPGGAQEAAIRAGLRARWAQRLAALGEPARTWAAGGLALLLATGFPAAEPAGAADRTAGAAGRTAGPASPVVRAVAVELLGPRASVATTLDELAGTLPDRVSWVFEGVRSRADLWMAEPVWWRRVERDGFALLRTGALSSAPALGAAAVLAADARRTIAALETAARGGAGDGESLEAFDALA